MTFPSSGPAPLASPVLQHTRSHSEISVQRPDSPASNHSNRIEEITPENDASQSPPPSSKKGSSHALRMLNLQNEQELQALERQLAHALDTLHTDVNATARMQGALHKLLLHPQAHAAGLPASAASMNEKLEEIISNGEQAKVVAQMSLELLQTHASVKGWASSQTAEASAPKDTSSPFWKSRKGLIVASAGAVAGSMALKNGAWQLGSILAKFSSAFSMAGVTPDQHWEIARRVLARWGVANLAAMGTEYPAGILSQLLWHRAGLSMNVLAAASQGFDMLTAIGAMKIAGHDLHSAEYVGMLGQAFAVLCSTGILTKAWDAAMRHSRPTPPAPETHELEQLPAPNEEDATPVLSPQLRRQAIGAIGEALNEMPAKVVAARKREVAGTIDTMEQTLASLNQFTTEDSDNTASAVAHPPVTEEFKEELLNQTILHLAAYKESLEKLGSSDTGVLSVVESSLAELKATEKELKSAQGNKTKAALLFGTIALGYLGTMLGGILAATVGEGSIRNVNYRGAVHSAGSVFGQVLAQGLPVVVGSNRDDSGLQRWGKALGVALVGTLLEFSQQQAGFALFEQGKHLAGKVIEAPLHQFPTEAQFRSVMELMKTYGLLKVFEATLDQPIEGRNYAGLAASMGFALFAMIFGYYQQRNHAPAG